MAEQGQDLFFKDLGVYVLGKDVPIKTLIVLPDADEVVIHVSSRDEHIALVCASGHVYTCNQVSDLCGMEKDAFTEPTLIPGLESMKMVHATCHINGIYLLSDKGEMYYVQYDQLGRATTKETRTPYRLNDLPLVMKMCTGLDHMIFLTCNGIVYVSGSNEKGQIGLCDTNKQMPRIKLPKLNVSIIDIACGSYHTALLTSVGSLLLSGCNEHNQVSTLEEFCVSSFISLPSLLTTAVACGMSHTVALAADNTAWAWGDNNYGQLGNGTFFKQLTPTRVMGLEGHVIRKVFAGEHSTAFVTDGGSVFVCGRYFSESIYLPRRLKMAQGLEVTGVAFGSTYSVIFVNRATQVLLPEKKVDIIKVHSDVSTPTPVTDTERLIMDSLDCPVCLKLMIAPIHLCTHGHNLCDSCFLGLSNRVCPICREQFTQGRNLALESIAAEVQLPCFSCLERLPVSRLLDHPDACASRQYKCPLDQSCNWNGLRRTLLSHATSEHSDLVHKNLPYTFSQTTSEELLKTELLLLHDELFTLHRKYDSDVNQAQIAVRHIGPPEEAKKYKCRLEWNADGFKWVSVVLVNISSYKGRSLEEIFHPENCASLKKSEVQEITVQTALELPCKISILKQ